MIIVHTTAPQVTVVRMDHDKVIALDVEVLDELTAALDDHRLMAEGGVLIGASPCRRWRSSSTPAGGTARTSCCGPS